MTKPEDETLRLSLASDKFRFFSYLDSKIGQSTKKNGESTKKIGELTEKSVNRRRTKPKSGRLQDGLFVSLEARWHRRKRYRHQWTIWVGPKMIYVRYSP